MKKLILVIAAVALIAAPALAVDWNFYGSARFQTVYSDDDAGKGGVNPAFAASGGAGGYPQATPQPSENDDQTLDWAGIPATSRIGARVKGEAIDGRFEFRPDYGGSWRLLWGEWKINSGLRFRVGKQWDPMNWFYSGQQINDTGMAGPEGAGGVITFRHWMLKLVIGEAQNLQVALIEANPATASGTSDVDEFWPKIQATYHFAGDAFFFDVGGTYWRYDTENDAPAAGAPDDTMTAYNAALGGGFNFGPAYIKADGWLGRNVSELGQFTAGNGYDGLPTVNAQGNYEDTDGWGALGVVGFRFTDQMAVEGGIGYENQEPDFAGAKEDETLAYYVFFNYTAAPGVSIIPEIGYIDYMDDSTGLDAGDKTYFSIKWQIDF